MRKYLNATGILLTAVVMASLAARAAGAQQGQQTTYTLPEYNSFQGCQAEKDPQAKVRCLDGFMAQYPNSTLRQYVFLVYYQTYFQLKNYAKCLENIDKLVALGDKADLASRVAAVQARVQVFPLTFQPNAPDAHDQLVKARDASLLGLKLIPELRKANASLTDDQVKPIIVALQASLGGVDYQLKDYPAAIDAFKAVLALTPNDGLTSYRLGLAYLQSTPPQSLDGFWALARAINLKVQDADKVKDYLRKTMVNYEQPNCDTLVDAQLSELLQLAANSQERPASYSIPAAADLQKIAQESTIVTLLSDLQAGGDKARTTWLALCGAEFPEVVGKIIDVSATPEAVTFHIFSSANQDEMQAATTANMEVHVTGQPDAARLAKDDPIRFSGTVAGYDAQPFLLKWDKCKVDPSIIPEKPEPGKRAPRRAPPKKTGA
jgi:tetratricopeptide (TPR) repeat protein